MIEESGFEVLRADMDHSADLHGRVVQIPDAEPSPDSEAHGLTHGYSVEVDQVAQGGACAMISRVMPDRQKYFLHTSFIISFHA